MLVAGDFNLQAWKISAPEACLGDIRALLAQRRNDGSTLLQFYADDRLFLSS